MNYNTITTLTTLARKFSNKYNETHDIDTEKRTWNCSDVFFGHREEDFVFDGCDCSRIEFDKRDWNEDARLIPLWALKRGDTVLSLKIETTFVSKTQDESGSISDTLNFSYIKDIGFANKYTKKTLQDTLNLSDSETLEINKLFEAEKEVLENL
jgi:hypothetical protein